MRETLKALKRLQNDPLWLRASAQFPKLDIGCGDCPIPGADRWDKPEGNAETLSGLKESSYGMIFSSHCLEHLTDWKAALSRWNEVLKPNGYLWVIIPDFELYEQGIWPSRFNSDHKHHFSISDLGPYLLRHYDVKRIQIVDTRYDYSLHGVDQTLGDAEAGIEFVIRK